MEKELREKGRIILMSLGLASLYFIRNRNKNKKRQNELNENNNYVKSHWDCDGKLNFKVFWFCFCFCFYPRLAHSTFRPVQHCALFMFNLLIVFLFVHSNPAYFPIGSEMFVWCSVRWTTEYVFVIEFFFFGFDFFSFLFERNFHGKWN